MIETFVFWAAWALALSISSLLWGFLLPACGALWHVPILPLWRRCALGALGVGLSVSALKPEYLCFALLPLLLLCLRGRVSSWPPLPIALILLAHSAFLGALAWPGEAVLFVVSSSLAPLLLALCFYAYLGALRALAFALALLLSYACYCSEMVPHYVPHSDLDALPYFVLTFSSSCLTLALFMLLFVNFQRKK